MGPQADIQKLGAVQKHLHRLGRFTQLLDEELGLPACARAS